MIDKNLTTLTITNNWAEKAKKNGNYEQKTIKIQRIVDKYKKRLIYRYLTPLS